MELGRTWQCQLSSSSTAELCRNASARGFAAWARCWSGRGGLTRLGLACLPSRAWGSRAAGRCGIRSHPRTTLTAGWARAAGPRGAAPRAPQRSMLPLPSRGGRALSPAGSLSSAPRHSAPLQPEHRTPASRARPGRGAAAAPGATLSGRCSSSARQKHRPRRNEGGLVLRVAPSPAEPAAPAVRPPITDRQAAAVGRNPAAPRRPQFHFHSLPAGRAAVSTRRVVTRPPERVPVPGSTPRRRWVR